MKHIVIAQPLAISASLLDTLTADFKKDGFTITAYDSLPKDQADLGDRLADADLAVIANYPLQKEALAKAASLKYLCVAFTGVDHVDIDFCKEKGIAVSNCAGYSTESVAELTFALILALYRKLSEGGCAARNGKTSAGLMGLDAALADLLREGKIAGAGIDVFDDEPPLAKDDPLLSAPNTVLTPHVGFFTEEAMARRAVIVMDNLRAYLKEEQENVIC